CATGHELSEPEHAAEARQQRAAVRAGVAGLEEVFVVLGPHHRGGPARGATGHLWTWDELVAVRREVRRRVVRRGAVRISGPGPEDDEVRGDRCGKQDRTLGVAAAPATPGVAVVVHIRGRCVRSQDEDVDVGRHPVGRGLLDVAGHVDSVRADRQVPDAVPREGPEGGDAACGRCRRQGTRRGIACRWTSDKGRQRRGEKNPRQAEGQADPGTPASPRRKVERRADAGGPGIRDRGYRRDCVVTSRCVYSADCTSIESGSRIPEYGGPVIDIRGACWPPTRKRL